ncbi:MFS transporter [Microvirga brassicacearum]|uniref:MFS transporter n=1 Tax=Microvirga brassicacearum TaxID=2580413 RepID=A0A5N3P950_9HYPH|nr:MFS transporter [Microvirga brassicacearum]KAB0266262.1 MFS transporter [Microvirga brassicacearum]
MSHKAALDWLNFLLADVRGGLGPYVSVFLLTVAHWDQATIGLVLTVSGMIGIAAHTPIGALIDATPAKRGLIITGVIALSASALAIAGAPILPVVLAADIVMAVLGAVLAPTVAAITLGLVGLQKFAARLGRNAAFDRTGNLFVAALAAAVGTMFGQRAVFYLVPFFAFWTVLVVLSIPGSAIDHGQARGWAPPHMPTAPASSAWRTLLTCRPLLILAVVAGLFHFANAAMLPLVSQKLALAHPGREAALTSAAIIVAQLVMVPVSLLVARANTIGRKPLLTFAIGALVLRGILFTLSENAVWLIAVQVLDGVGIGLFDALLPLLVADIMHGTGRYNVARGLVGTIQGIGGSLSQAAGGFAVVWFGYDAAFLILAGIALMPLILALAAMPETRPIQV